MIPVGFGAGGSFGGAGAAANPPGTDLGSNMATAAVAEALAFAAPAPGNGAAAPFAFATPTGAGGGVLAGNDPVLGGIGTAFGYVTADGMTWALAVGTVALAATDLALAALAN